MRELAAADLLYERQIWPRDEAHRLLRRARRAAQGAADRGEDARASRRSRSTRSRTARRSSTSASGRTCPSSGKLKAFKLLSTSNAYWKGDAKNQPMQRDVRHGVLQRQGPPGVPDAARGSQEARPPQGRPRDGPVHVPPVGARRGVLAGQGHDAVQHAGRLHARGALSGRLRRGEDAAHLQQGALGDVGPLAALPPEHVPGRVRARAHGASRR